MAAALWFWRASLRKRHIVGLVVLTARGVVGLGVFALLGLSKLQVPGPLVMAGLHGSAVLVAGCGPNVLLAWA